jgi:hypothetical protein
MNHRYEMQTYIEQDSKFVLLSWHSYCDVLESFLTAFSIGDWIYFNIRPVTTFNYNSLTGLHTP